MRYDRLLASLPSPLAGFLRQAGEIAVRQGFFLYLVGGAVRDLLLGRPVLDIDLVVAGDAASLAAELVSDLGCKIIERSQFGTVKLEWQSLPVDVATARSESYHHPGALPTVAPGTIADDLARRDFSINALALSLHPDRWGELLDPHGGQGDLARKVVRVLHAKSFQDDATRILRALRYCARLGFQLEEQTGAWLLRDRDKLSAIGGERLFRELELILGEERPEAALARCQEYGELSAIHPALRFTPEMARWYVQAREAAAGEPAVYLCLLAYPLSRADVMGVAQRLKLSGRRSQALRQTVTLREQLPELNLPSLAPSALYRTLEQYLATPVWALAMATAAQLEQERLGYYLKELRLQHTFLSGGDLVALGIPQGPEVGRRLRQLLEARLDGLVADREGEVALVRRWATEYSPERK